MEAVAWGLWGLTACHEKRGEIGKALKVKTRRLGIAIIFFHSSFEFIFF